MKNENLLYPEKKSKANWLDLTVKYGFFIYTLGIKTDVMNLD